MLSIYAGMRVGEIAALKVSDIINQYGEVRSEIKLAPDQTKGSKGRTVILSRGILAEIGLYAKSQPPRHPRSPLIFSQRSRQGFSALTLSMLFKEIYEFAGIRPSSKCQGDPDENDSAANGPSAHQHNRALLRGFGGHASKRSGGRIAAFGR